MYSVYITNKLGNFVHVRLSVEKMQYADDYLQKLQEVFLKEYNQRGSGTYELNLLMSLGGFCSIPAGGTRTFSVENMAATMYVSVAESAMLRVVNLPFDPKRYGCMAILFDSGIAILPYNPEAVWMPAKKGDQLQSDVLKAGPGRRYNEQLFFGRKASVNGGMPCAVTSSDGILCSMWLMAGNNVAHDSGELLKNTGFELIRAKRGDPIPPNAIMTGVTEADGSLFVGRVGGTFPCYITTDEDCKIHSFVYGFDKERRVANGEVMVLTR